MNKIYFLLIFLITTNVFSQNDFNNLKGKKILVVYGGWEGHQPKIFAEKITKWLLDQKAEVKLVKGTSIYTDSNVMNDLDLIIQHITMSKMSPLETKGLINAIARGVGLAGCHGGLGDSFRDNTEYQYMV